MKRTAFLSTLSLGLIPVTLLVGSALPGRWYYLTGTVIILQTMLPFFLIFEAGRPKARELVLIAVMCALAAVSRVVFVMPNFKPTIAVIMLGGIAFGPQAGFLIGSVSAFASNFFYGHGPWTPWQMLAYGAAGLLAALVFYRRSPKVWNMCLFGFFAVTLLIGPLLDLCSLFTIATEVSLESAALVFTAGFGMNLVQAACTAASLALFGKPLLQKLQRIRRKYGMEESDGHPESGSLQNDR